MAFTRATFYLDFWFLLNTSGYAREDGFALQVVGQRQFLSGEDTGRPLLCRSTLRRQGREGAGDCWCAL